MVGGRDGPKGPRQTTSTTNGTLIGREDLDFVSRLAEEIFEEILNASDRYTPRLAFDMVRMTLSESRAAPYKIDCVVN